MTHPQTTHAPATHTGADTRPGADALVTQPAPGHFEISQHRTAGDLVSGPDNAGNHLPNTSSAVGEAALFYGQHRTVGDSVPLPGNAGDLADGAPSAVGEAAHFELEFFHQRERSRLLLSQLRDPDRAQSENEMWAIASENAGIRRELRRAAGRRVEE